MLIIINKKFSNNVRPNNFLIFICLEKGIHSCSNNNFFEDYYLELISINNYSERAWDLNLDFNLGKVALYPELRPLFVISNKLIIFYNKIKFYYKNLQSEKDYIFLAYLGNTDIFKYIPKNNFRSCK